ncbi:hypothetical protein S40288_10292 [Stachybotrys chartarum IBT 40288]|nr:hypothetical protein S40288_10292 [Stachybotrys chartarum IBT 40288]
MSQELLAALRFIRNFYYDVFENDQSMMQRLSRTDIEHLQLTAPGACERDFQDLNYRVKGGKILAAFSANYRDMPKPVCQKLANPKNGEANETVLYEFASLADKLGLETQEIHDLVEHDPDEKIARRLLRTARDPSQYRYKDFKGCVGRLVEIIHEAEPLGDENHDDVEVGDDNNDNLHGEPNLQEERAPNRCGILNDADQVRDRPLMYLPKLHYSTGARQAELTSFFVQKSLYLFFFGKDAGIDFEKDLEQVSSDGLKDLMHREQLLNSTERSSDNRNQEGDNLQDEQVEIGQDSIARLDDAKRELEAVEVSIQLKETEQQDQETRLKDLERIISQKEEILKSLQVSVDKRKHDLASQTVDFQQVWARNIVQNANNVDEGWQAKLDQFTKQEQEWRAKIAQLAREEQQKQKTVEELKAMEHTERAKLQELENEKKRLIENQTLGTVRLGQKSLIPEELNSTNEPDEQSPSKAVHIRFMQRCWAVLHEVVVDQIDSTKEVQRVGIKLMGKQMGLFDSEMRALTVYNCFQRVTKTGSNTIFVIPGWEVDRTANIEQLAEYDEQSSQKKAMLKRIWD